MSTCESSIRGLNAYRIIATVNGKVRLHLPTSVEAKYLRAIINCLSTQVRHSVSVLSRNWGFDNTY